MKWVASFLLVATTLAAAASPLDDKALAFEKAVDATQPDRESDRPGFPSPQASAVEPLLHHDENLPMLENVIRQLMTARPSTRVERTGNELLEALEQEQNERVRTFTTQAESLLAKAKKIVLHAKTPADLDAILSQLRPLTELSNQWSYTDSSALALMQKVNSAQQFVLAWQDYLSASVSGQTDQAQQALERILNNPQVIELDFIPRSELLLRRDGPPLLPAGTSPGGKSAMDQVNDILSKVKTLDDVFTAVDEISKISNSPVDLSDISTLQKQRVDVLAGLPVTLDLKAAVSGHIYGDDISRIENMELLALLPYYLETHDSNPPKSGETVVSYLERLETEADAAGNLALLQRALAVQAGLDDAEHENPADATSQFLGGLSQEAAGEYKQAVVTYETTLQTYSPLLSAKIVGDRLAAIKAAHPDDFSEGLSDFNTPATPNYPPGFLPGYRPGWPPGYPFNRPQVVAELPIPLVISIPAHRANPAATPANK